MSKPTGKPTAPKKTARPSVIQDGAAKAASTTEGTVYMFPPRLGTAQTMEAFMTQKKTQYDKIAQDAASAQKEHLDALMQSGKIAMEGMEDILKTCMTLTQTMAEKNAQAFKALIGCKTLNELTEAQTRATQTSFDDIMAGATRLSELTVKMTTDALEPINEQFTRSMKFANDTLAA